MNAKEIESIANAVVANLSGGGTSPLGCGAVSSTEAFESGPVYACSGSYECGGAGVFNCPEAFTCVHTFDCPQMYHLETSCLLKFECDGTYGPCWNVAQFSPCSDSAAVYAS